MMKKLSLILLLSICVNTLFAQARKTTGVSEKPKTVNFSDNRIPDYQLNLIHLEQHPLPAAEYGNKKEELHKLRQLKEQDLQNIKEPKKTRGLAPNPAVIKGIQGNISNSTPNDNDVAVSNGGKVISVVNSNARIYDDTGMVIVNKTLTSIFTQVGNFSWISDPRVLYDPVADRFVMVCFSGSVSYESTILVGFSQTNDPSGNWNVYTLNGNSFNDSTWSDYPIISLSDKDFFITFNQVKDNVHWSIGFKQSVIWQIDKQSGYSGNPLLYNLWDSINYNGKPLRNICPAKYQLPPFGNNMYFLTLRNVDMSNDSIFVSEITNSYISGAAALNIKVLQTPVHYGFPPNARQKKTGNVNNYLQTNDARVLAAIYENDYIHFGSNTVNPTYMNAAVYLGRIAGISTATPVVSADIISSATMEYGYPSMTLMGNTNDHRVMYTFSHCITDSFPGTSVMYKDANNNYSDIIPVKNGTSIINILGDSVERWGDYTNIQRVYNNANRAYLSGSWGKSSGNNCWVSIVDNGEWVLQSPAVETSQHTEIYPNPVTQQRFTTRFSLNQSAHIRFELFDMLGKRVALFLDTYIKQGLNEFSFSTGNFPAGNYFLKMSNRETGDIQTEKISIE